MIRGCCHWVAADMKIPVAYIPGLVMRRAAELYPGEAKTDPRDSFVIADTARIHQKRIAWVDVTDEVLVDLAVLCGYDEDLGHDAARGTNRLRPATPDLHQLPESRAVRSTANTEVDAATTASKTLYSRPRSHPSAHQRPAPTTTANAQRARNTTLRSSPSHAAAGSRHLHLDPVSEHAVESAVADLERGGFPSGDLALRFVERRFRGCRVQAFEGLAQSPIEEHLSIAVAFGGGLTGRYLRAVEDQVPERAEPLQQRLLEDGFVDAYPPHGLSFCRRPNAAELSSGRSRAVLGRAGNGMGPSCPVAPGVALWSIQPILSSSHADRSGDHFPR